MCRDIFFGCPLVGLEPSDGSEAKKAESNSRLICHVFVVFLIRGVSRGGGWEAQGAPPYTPESATVAGSVRSRKVAAAKTKEAPDATDSVDPPPHGGRWTFLTNHSHVLILLSRNPSIVLRQVAQLVGITERAVQRIIADLEEEGFIEREKVGRQNHYRILTDQQLRHSVEAHCTIGDLLSLIEKTR